MSYAPARSYLSCKLSSTFNIRITVCETFALKTGTLGGAVGAGVHKSQQIMREPPNKSLPGTLMLDAPLNLGTRRRHSRPVALL
jgi:hypothetical protein